MPELTERNLLCRTCGCPQFIGDTTFTTHNAAVIGGAPVMLCYGGCMHAMPPVPAHPFDGVPYVRCRGCRGSGLDVGPTMCPSCGGLGWVKEMRR